MVRPMARPMVRPMALSRKRKTETARRERRMAWTRTGQNARAENSRVSQYLSNSRS